MNLEPTMQEAANANRMTVNAVVLQTLAERGVVNGSIGLMFGYGTWRQFHRTLLFARRLWSGLYSALMRLPEHDVRYIFYREVLDLCALELEDGMVGEGPGGWYDPTLRCYVMRFLYGDLGWRLCSNGGIYTPQVPCCRQA